MHSDHNPQFLDEEYEDLEKPNEDPRFLDKENDDGTSSEPLVKSKYFLANFASRVMRLKKTAPEDDQASEEEDDESDLSELSSPESDIEEESLGHKE